MNVVDMVVLVGLVYVGLRGFRQGALSQVAALAGAAGGLVGGALAAPRLARAIGADPGPDLALLTLGLLLGIVLLGQGIGVTIGLRLRRGAERIGIGSIDRALGIAVGVGWLLITVWLLASVLIQGPVPALARELRQSRAVAVLAAALPAPPDVFGRVSVYLDRQGFPQAFAEIRGVTSPPVSPPTEGAVAAAAERGELSTVQVEALGCGGLSSGSGFVTEPGFVVTNAHVIAGGRALSVRDRSGPHEAVAIHVDPRLDLAVLSAPGITAAPIDWVVTPSERGTAGATLGYPGGQRELDVRPAAVRARLEAVGRDIYGQGMVARDLLTLSSTLARGDSGGPFVTSEGLVGGVVFAAAAAEPGVGYALTAEEVSDDVAAAITRNTPVGTGACRY